MAALVPLLASVAFLGVVGLWDPAPAQAHASTPPRCARLTASEDGRPYNIEPEGQGQDVVDVVLRLMKNKACQDMCESLRCPSRSPACRWTPAKVDLFFGRNGAVNRIWQQAGIRLAIVAVEQCLYRSEDFGRPAGEFTMGPVDARLDSDFDTFADRVTRRFGTPKKLNLLVWLRIDDWNSATITYWGTSPHRHPPTPGTVWADVLCVVDGSEGDGFPRKFSTDECARKLAHEVGHAFTLQHVPADATAVASEGSLFPECAVSAPSDPERLTRNLMQPNLRDDAAGHDALTEAQKCRARKGVAAFYR